MRIRYTRGATSQLAGISLYIREHNPSAASRVRDRLRQVVAMLAERPALGSPGRVPGTREFKVPGLPYRIVYRVAVLGSEECLEILRVQHEAQDKFEADWQ